MVKIQGGERWYHPIQWSAAPVLSSFHLSRADHWFQSDNFLTYMPVCITASPLQIYLGLDHICRLYANESLLFIFCQIPQEYIHKSAFIHVSGYSSSSKPHPVPPIPKLWHFCTAVRSVDKTPTFRHVQGGVRMVATGYVLIKVDIILLGVFGINKRTRQV